MDTIDNNVIRTGRSLSWLERESMIMEYLTTNLTKNEVWKKYTGQDVEHGRIIIWMRKLGYEDKKIEKEKIPLDNFISESMGQKPLEDNAKLSEDRLKSLEKELELAKIKLEGLEMMIEIAEKELKIPIRKKSNTK